MFFNKQVAALQSHSDKFNTDYRIPPNQKLEILTFDECISYIRSVNNFNGFEMEIDGIRIEGDIFRKIEEIRRNKNKKYYDITVYHNSLKNSNGIDWKQCVIFILGIMYQFVHQEWVCVVFQEELKDDYPEKIIELYWELKDIFKQSIELFYKLTIEKFTNLLLKNHGVYSKKINKKYFIDEINEIWDIIVKYHKIENYPLLITKDEWDELFI